MHSPGQAARLVPRPRACRSMPRPAAPCGTLPPAPSACPRACLPHALRSRPRAPAPAACLLHAPRAQRSAQRPHACLRSALALLPAVPACVPRASCAPSVPRERACCPALAVSWLGWPLYYNTVPPCPCSTVAIHLSVLRYNSYLHSLLLQYSKLYCNTVSSAHQASCNTNFSLNQPPRLQYKPYLAIQFSQYCLGSSLKRFSCTNFFILI